MSMLCRRPLRVKTGTCGAGRRAVGKWAWGLNRVDFKSTNELYVFSPRLVGSDQELRLKTGVLVISFFTYSSCISKRLSWFLSDYLLQISYAMDRESNRLRGTNLFFLHN